VAHLDAGSKVARLAATGVVLLALASCTDAHPLAVTWEGAADLAPSFSAHDAGRQILMLDACDPESFNAAFGFEICTPVNRRGGIPFDTFIAQLQRHQRVEAWRFSPGVIRVPRTTTIRVVNAGGIPHNLVEVAEFGPGIVPELNELSGNPGEPVPECLGAPLVAPGDHVHMTFEPGDEKKYMCCIHPWMRAVSH